MTWQLLAIVSLVLLTTAAYSADPTTARIKRDYQRTQQLESRWQRTEQPLRHSLGRDLELRALSKEPYGSGLKNHPCKQYRQRVAEQAKRAEQLTPPSESNRRRLARQIRDSERQCKKALGTL